MADADIITTIALSGADDVAKELGGIGKAGEEAFQAIAKAATPLAGLLGEIGRAGSEALKEIAGAVSPIEGAIAGAAAAFTGLFEAAKGATEAAHSLEILSQQSGESVESISALEGAIVSLGGSTEGISGAFRRMGQTISREWEQIKKDVASAGDTIIGDSLKVDKAQESVFKAQQARAKAFGERGASPLELQREKEREATTALAEAEHAQAEAEKKQREDQMNSFAAYSKAVNDIIKGQKTFGDAGKEANLSVQNVLKGLIGDTEGADEAFKNFNGNLNSIVGQGPKTLEVFKNLADFIKNSGDATLNQSLLMRLFGRTMGSEMLPALSKGSEAFEEQEKRIKALGLAITDDMTKPAAEFHETYNRLTDDISRTSVQAGLKFDPAMTAGMEEFTKIIEENRGNIMQLVEALAAVVTAIGQVVGAVEGMGDAFAKVFNEASKYVNNFAKALGDKVGTTAFGPWLERQLGFKPGTITPKAGEEAPGFLGKPGEEAAPPAGKPDTRPQWTRAMEENRKTEEREARERKEKEGPHPTTVREMLDSITGALTGRPPEAAPTGTPGAPDVEKKPPEAPAAAEPSILQKLFDMLPPLFATPAKVEEAPPGAAPAAEKPSEAAATAGDAAAALTKIPSPADATAESLAKVSAPADAAAAALSKVAETPAADKAAEKPAEAAAPAGDAAAALDKIPASADATAESLSKVSSPADATAESLAKVSAPADAAETSLNKIPAAADAAAEALSKVGASGGGGEKPSAPATAPEGKAGGGAVGGWGSGKSDSVPIMASKGEFVVTADGSNLGDAIRYFGGRHIPGFQDGGIVPFSSIPRESSFGPGEVTSPAQRSINEEIDRKEAERQKKQAKAQEEYDKEQARIKKQQEMAAPACDAANKIFNSLKYQGVHRRAVGFENNPGYTEEEKRKFVDYNNKYDQAEAKAKEACEKAGKAFRDTADPHSLASLLAAQASDPQSLANLLGAQASQTASMVAGSGGAGWISGGHAEGGLIGDIPGFAAGGPVCEDCGETRVDTSRMVANLAQAFTGGGLINGFVNSIATIPSYASGGPVNGSAASSSNTLGYHTLDIRTSAGNFSARVDEDTMEALRNSSLAGKLSQTGTRPSWFS